MHVRSAQSTSFYEKLLPERMNRTSKLLARLVVAAAAIANDLNAGERERDVRRSRREQLLARLGRQYRVLAAQRRIADRTHGLARGRTHRRRQAVLLGLARPLPRCKVARFPVRVPPRAVSWACSWDCCSAVAW